MYLDANRTGWNDPNFRSAFYKSLLQTREASAAAAQLAPLNSGDPAAVAYQYGRIAGAVGCDLSSGCPAPCRRAGIQYRPGIP